MNRKLSHRGTTGLRLDGYDGSAIDTHIDDDMLNIYICEEGWGTSEAKQASVRLDETEVKLLIEEGMRFLLSRANLDYP